MKEIKCLVKLMHEELCDAEKYARLYQKYKDDDRQLAEMFKVLSGQELEHMNMEHQQAVRLIRQFRDSGKEAPAEMMAIWDWEHEQMIEQEQDVRIMLSK